VGGKGGDGGSGTAGVGLLVGGTGGAGGPGTSADGGCIYDNSSISSDLIVRDSSLINCQAIGGAAGKGGDGGLGSSAAFNGAGGAGGYGGFAQGGAIYFIGKGTLSIYNSTIADSTASSGGGGDGGTGNLSLVTVPGGNGGGGGGANGGLVYATNYNQETGNAVELVFATLASGALAPGLGGNGGAGATPGQGGSTNLYNGGAAIGSANATALSTVIVGAAQLPLCGSHITTPATGWNLDEDSSCAFTLHGTLAQLFRPLDANQALPAYVPTYHSMVIDAALSCDDLDFITLTADQYGTARPQGSACDLGAIEADYIFVDGMD
jgi:hypothetical protein